LGDGFKTAISEYYANTGNWPALANLTGLNSSVGKYESSVTVLTAGAIQITYGGQANSKITGQTLSINPYTNANSDVIWVCGTAATPTGVSSAGAAGATSISPQYLPTSCHS
jgi:type IV pilus assembly protein PilA